MAEGDSAIVADLGANLVCVLLILLAVATVQARQTAANPATTVAAHPVRPLSGPAQSDLLYLRLRPDPSVLGVEVTAAGAFAMQPGEMRPLVRLPVPAPRRVVAYIFAPGPYAELRRLTDATGVELAEITVPQALRRPDPVAGQSAFSPAFLSLDVGSDPASIRPPLLALLTGSGAAAGLEADGEPNGGITSLWMVLRQAGNLAALVVALAILRSLRRRLRS